MSRSVIINMQAPSQVRSLIDDAAVVEGKTRTEFMLDAASRRAQEVLANQRIFYLDPEQYNLFIKLLDTPTLPTSELRELLENKQAKTDQTSTIKHYLSRIENVKGHPAECECSCGWIGNPNEFDIHIKSDTI